jgi:Uma2 family endonuclease
VIEISESSLDRDREKLAIYAEAAVPEYWIVNLIDGQIEVYTEPTGPKRAAKYRRRRDYQPGQSAPLAFAGEVVGEIRVDDVLP